MCVRRLWLGPTLSFVSQRFPLNRKSKKMTEERQGSIPLHVSVLGTRELASYGSTLLLSDNYSFRAVDVLILCRLTFISTQEECKKPVEKKSNARTLLNVRPNKG